MVRVDTDKSSNDYTTRSCMAWSMEQNWVSRSESRKTRMEKREAKTRQCSTTERNLLYWSRWRRIQGNPSKMRGQNWKGLWQRPCRAKRRFIPAPGNWWRRLNASHKGSKDKNRVVLWNLMNPQGNEWNPLYLKNHEDHLASAGYTSMTHHNLVHKFIPTSTSDENSGCKSSSG